MERGKKKTKELLFENLKAGRYLLISQNLHEALPIMKWVVGPQNIRQSSGFSQLRRA
jgi:hypothetical protein